MSELHVTTLTGGEATLQDTVLADLKAHLRGPLLLPGDDGYDTTRQLWNGMLDKRPALIARCMGVADVLACVNFARAHNVLVAVRGGDHSVAGNASCNGGFMIDLSPMKSVHVDPGKQTARAGGGARWGDLDHETQAFGLATTGGTNSDTGIAGLTLGGGIGWLSGKYGLACDNLLSADVVTADGRLLTASATENQDLFWGLRGGCVDPTGDPHPRRSESGDLLFSPGGVQRWHLRRRLLRGDPPQSRGHYHGSQPNLDGGGNGFVDPELFASHRGSAAPSADRLERERFRA